LNKNVFTREDLLARTRVSEEILGRWIREKLVRPAGYTDDRRPLFSEETAARLDSILKLQELGYGPEEIQKGIRKIGLPGTQEERAENGNLDKYLTIGNLAERAGVSPRTIKHWEDKGIIEPDMRSEGGFRLYSGGYVHLCELVRDLQLFGYTLEEIKKVSEYFRYFLAIQENPDAFPKAEVSSMLDAMLTEIKVLFDKMGLLQKGIKRWEDLMKKKRKEILDLKNRNQRRENQKSKGEHQ